MPNVSNLNWDNEYYQNVTENDIRELVDLEEIFSFYEFEINSFHCDLYFVGIKKWKN